MMPHNLETGTIIEEEIQEDLEEVLEPQYRVLVHNDPITTFEYVIGLLKSIFRLSGEIADHIARTAHNYGFAVVVVRPRPEAESLSKAANTRARGDGYPLTFTIEPEE